MATVSKANGRNAPDAADVAAQLEAVKADLAALTETMSGFAKGKGAEVRDQATLTAQKVGEDAAELADQAGAMVRQNPGTAIGAAAAVGFLVGFLTSRR